MPSLEGDKYASISVSETLIDGNSTPDEVGNKFVAPFTMRVAGISFITYVNNANYVCTLYDDADTVLATVTYPSRVVFATISWYPFVFTDPVTLTRGETYRATCKPESGGTSFYYYDYTTFNVGAQDGGTSLMKTSRADAGAWTDTADARVRLRLIVSGIEQGGASSGGGEHAYPLIASRGLWHSIVGRQ